MNTYELTTAFAALSQMFESGELEEDVYNDTLESLPIEEAAEQVAKIRKNYDGNIKEIDDEISRLKARKEQMKNAKERANQSLLKLCHMRGGRIKTALFTVSPSKRTAVNITDEDAISDAFKEYTQVVSIDKKAIREFLESGVQVEGAELVQNESVSIR